MSRDTTDTHAGQPLEAFVDALGVVIARILTMFAFGLVVVAPYTIAAIFFGSVSYFWAAFISMYSFLWLSFIMLIEYVLWIKDREADISNAPAPVILAIVVTSVPAIPFVITLIPAIAFSDRLTKKTFMTNPEFDVLMLFVMSFVTFCLGCSFISHLEGGLFFLSPTPFSIAESFTFGSDLVLKGVFFDVFEHFGLSVSTVTQSGNLLGLALSFVLRLTSSALVLSIGVELFQTTRLRLTSGAPLPEIKLVEKKRRATTTRRKKPNVVADETNKNEQN